MDVTTLVSVMSGLGGLAMWIGLPVALFIWGRSVARRMGTPGLQRLSYLPLVALALSLVAFPITIGLLVYGFATVQQYDAGSRATVLARSIADGMNVGAAAWISAAALYVVSVLAFGWGEWRLRRGLSR